MGDDRTLPCDAALPQVLKPAADSAARGLPRAKLTWQSGGGTQTLFVYGGNTLQLGRNSDIEGQNGLCLRLRPRQGNEQLIRCISGRHCQFYVRDQRLYLRDTTGRGRTLVNEHVLGDDEELLDTTRLMIAHVLALRARPIPAPLSAPPVVEGALPPEPASILDCKLSDEPDHGPGVVDAESPALWLTRTHNGTEHRYALVPGRLDLKATADGWEPAARGQEPDLELFTAKQQLWLRTADLDEGECLAVADGVQVSGAGLTGSFSPIRAEDQK
jgi:hypothetical protein